jgi:hypothetical protein
MRQLSSSDKERFTCKHLDEEVQVDFEPILFEKVIAHQVLQAIDGNLYES